MTRTQNKSKDQTKAAAPEEKAAPENAAQGTQEGTMSQEAAQGTQEGTMPPEIIVTVSVPETLRGLNLRDGPGKAFNVLNVVPNGTQLIVLQLPKGAEVPGYALVRYEGDKDGPLVGWVNTDFVQED